MKPAAHVDAGACTVRHVAKTRLPRQIVIGYATGDRGMDSFFSLPCIGAALFVPDLVMPHASVAMQKHGSKGKRPKTTSVCCISIIKHLSQERLSEATMSLPALEQYALDTRSPTYKWLWEHHDEVVEFMATWGRGRYLALAKSVNEAGIKSTKENVRIIWLRVADDKAKVAARNTFAPNENHRRVFLNTEETNPSRDKHDGV
jgi:hypothetical protein